jgi:hypothetical protein
MQNEIDNSQKQTGLKVAYVNNKQGRIVFIEEPQDAYVTKTPAVVRCSVQNAHIAYIECNGKINDFTNQDLQVHLPGTYTSETVLFASHS